MAQEVYDDYEDDVQDEMEEATLSAALADQMGAAPWYVSSVAIHCVIFLFLMLIPVDPPQERHNRVVINTEVVEEEEEEELEEPEPEIEEKDPEVVDQESEVTVDQPVVKTTDVEVSDHFETEDDMDEHTALGDPNNISDVDHEFVGSPALMGVGASGGKGGGGRFGFRNGGGRRAAVRRGGGSRKTESAVNWALEWLAEHQESEGFWDCDKYAGGNEVQGKGITPPGDVAVTSLAILAFLGAGNSTRFGKYRKNVKAGVEWLMTKFEPTGCVGRHRYEGAIAVMALSEAYGMSSGGKLKKAAQRAVDWACKAQCPSGGWDYVPTNPVRVDTSVAGWWIMGLKSAKVAGLHIKGGVMEKAKEYIQHATTEDGTKTSYATENVTSPAQVTRGGGSYRMTAVALTCLQFLGVDRTDPQIVGAANQSIRTRPNPERFDFYNWYYQALGFFQLGIRSQHWKTFNEPMKLGLLSTQVRTGTFKQNKGSWNPDTDQYGKSWGRVGQTALGALMLEVYYRYHEVSKH